MNSKRIGLVQTGGIGDIIIALPIADFYLSQGHEVYWPIDARYLPIFQPAKPAIHFLPVQDGPGRLVINPLRLLNENACDAIFSLYSCLDGSEKVINHGLANALKFDEYKYAVAGVPFTQKWTLTYNRNLLREQELFDHLNISGPYICLHEEGSNLRMNMTLPVEMTAGFQIIRMTPQTDNPLDWFLTLERAAKLVLLDSCFANLVDQMNLPNEKYLILRSPIQLTPVFKNGWQFRFINR